jgi:predicted SAM-dependent methyltransferase
MQHNILRKLPFKDNSVDYIFSEHTLEHFTYEHAEKILKECRRVLGPAGIIRISVPDLSSTIEKYKDGSGLLFRNTHQKQIAPLKTNADFINSVFSQFGHKYQYDAEALKRIMGDCGFTSLVIKDRGISTHDVLKNLERREYDVNSAIKSLHIEGCKGEI